MAEGILREKLRESGIPAFVDSCGFEAFHAGDRPDGRAQAVALRHGIDISSHLARLFSSRDFDRFDYIYVMDAGHYQGVMRKARNQADRAKTDYILNVLHPGKNLGVTDPWYGNEHSFEEVYRLLDRACDALAEQLKTGIRP